MAYKYYIVITTVDNDEQAQKIIDAILNKKLCACVNSFQVTSQYWWEGKIQKHAEIILLIKTLREKFHELQNTIKENHPYQVPEIIALPIIKGYTKYLAWLQSCVES